MTRAMARRDACDSISSTTGFRPAASARPCRSCTRSLRDAAGLKPVVLDIESHASRLAMARVIAALPNQGRDALVALFEIGAETTSLKVLRDDDMLYDRDQAFGGSQLTQLISRQYGFSFEEAEQKKLASDLPEDFDSAILVQELSHYHRFKEMLLGRR